MQLFRWLRGLFQRRSSPDLVPFLDAASGRVVRIPASELLPGVVQVRIGDSAELVWALPEQLQGGELRHGEFDEETREYLRQIQAAFQEHYPKSLAEWEEGFRRDTNPDREIALWSHAADIYTEFAGNEPAVERRQDVFRCIVACLTAGPDDVWHVLRPESLSRDEARRIVNRFYGNDR